jgi:hypothetical protein
MDPTKRTANKRINIFGLSFIIFPSLYLYNWYLARYSLALFFLVA